MRRRLRVTFDTLRANFFALPAAAVVVAFIAARLATRVDAGSWAGEATVDSARAVLSTVAAATITFASISFSVSLLIMQQGSNQFSPRLVHGLVRDPFNRRVIAFVLATFTYCLVVLQRVRGPIIDGGEALIPQFAVAVGLVLGVIAVLAVVAAIHHTSRRMDISAILNGIVNELSKVNVHGLPEGFVGVSDTALPVGPPATFVVRFRRDGWIREIDYPRIVSSLDPGSTARLETTVGRYAISGAPACTVWCASSTELRAAAIDAIVESIDVGTTRTMVQDGAFSVRQLVDVALKALSPGVNDPTTAQDAIFHLGSVLVILLRRDQLPAAIADGRGCRLMLPHTMTAESIIELAFSELRLTAAGNPTVVTYLLEMLTAVVAAVRDEVDATRVESLIAQGALIEQQTRLSNWIDADREWVDAALDRLRRG